MKFLKKHGSCQAVGPDPPDSALTASDWSNESWKNNASFDLALERLEKCYKGKFDKNNKKQSVTKETKGANGRKRIDSDKDDRAPKQHSKEMNKDAPIAVCLGALFRGRCLVRWR